MLSRNRNWKLLFIILSVSLMISLYFNIRSLIQTNSNSIVGTYQTLHFSKNKLVFLDDSKVAYNYYNSETEQMVVEYGTYTIEEITGGYLISMRVNDVSYILDCSENYKQISFITHSSDDAVIVSLYNKVSEQPILQD